MKKYIKNIYRELNGKQKISWRDNSYTDIMLQTICGMFNWRSNVGDNSLVHYLRESLELNLRMWGKVAITKVKDEIRLGRCEWGMSPTWTGDCEKVIIWFCDGSSVERTNYVDCVVIKNNILEMSDRHMTRFVQQLSDVDLSQVDLLVNARCHPIVLCKDDETAAIITKAFQGSKDGSPIAIASDNLLSNDLLGVQDSVKVITTTDPQTASLFQYYSHYHLDLCSRLYGLYGLSTFNTGIMSQTNDTKVMGSLASSMVIPLENYKCRMLAVDEINKLYNIGLSVEFGECWKNQLNMLNGFAHKDFNVVNDIENDIKLEDNSKISNGGADDETI